MNVYVAKGLKAGGAVLLLLLLTVWFGRSAIIRYYADRKISVLSERLHLRVHYASLGMKGCHTLYINDLSVVPADADTFLQAKSFEVKFDLLSLLLLKADVRNITADELHIHFIKKGAASNFDFLYKQAGPQEKETVPESNTDFSRKVRKTFGLLYKLLPENTDVNNLCLFYSNTGDELKIEIPALSIKDNRFATTIHSTENGVRSEWMCKGSLNDAGRQIQAMLYTDANTKISLPFLQYRWGACVQFDTLAFELGSASKGDLETIRGKALVSGLTLHQERISPDTVLLDKGLFSYQVNVGKNYFELDSTTDVCFNKLDFHPYLKAAKDSAWRITASVDKRDFAANDLFSSLPRGLFYNLEGLESEGTLSYHFLLDVDFAQVDSLVFESTIQSKNFRILQYGNTDLRKMSEPFVYTAYENGEPVRSFETGPECSSFRSFGNVSRYLPLCILQSEDAGFFYHAGFIPSAIRESLVLDLKEHRFARGGSTLSMQLVKNVFLSRNKTIARKLEEILIVWLIENNRLTSKERMFEVYLNIIEWGPMIYGAAEASRFYLAKEPSQLSLGECIFLASIIPKPKHVRSCFDGLNLKPYYDEFFSVILTRLVDRGLISPEEAVGVTPASVQITGPAKAYLAGVGAEEEAQPEQDEAATD